MNSDGSMTFVVADDHPMFRVGLCGVIARNSRYHVIGEADDGEAAWRIITERKPDIAVLDIEMPGMTGLDVADAIYKADLPVSVIILTMYEEYALFNRAIDSGVKGYILKESAVTDIMSGIEVVTSGGYYFSPSLTAHFHHRSLPQRDEDIGETEKRLTATEKHVLSLLSESHSSRQIADLLHVSVRTVEGHRYKIAQKLGLQGSYALLRYALTHRG